MKKVKVVCNGCNGKGYWDEVEHGTGRPVKVICEACGGCKYLVWNELEEEEVKKE